METADGNFFKEEKVARPHGRCDNPDMEWREENDGEGKLQVVKEGASPPSLYVVLAYVNTLVKVQVLHTRTAYLPMACIPSQTKRSVVVP